MRTCRRALAALFAVVMALVLAPVAAHAAGPVPHYLMTAFTNSSESNMYVYDSPNASAFTLVRANAYTPPSGLIRDPSVHAAHRRLLLPRLHDELDRRHHRLRPQRRLRELDVPSQRDRRAERRHRQHLGAGVVQGHRRQHPRDLLGLDDRHGGTVQAVPDHRHQHRPVVLERPDGAGHPGQLHRQLRGQGRLHLPRLPQERDDEVHRARHRHLAHRPVDGSPAPATGRAGAPGWRGPR